MRSETFASGPERIVTVRPVSRSLAAAGVAVLLSLLWVGNPAQAASVRFDPEWTGTRHDFVFALAARGRELWAAGSFGLMLRRSGGSWQHVSGTGPLSLFGLAFAPNGVGVAVGQVGLVLETEPYSDNWSRHPLDIKRRLFTVAAGPGGDFLIAGQFGSLSYRGPHGSGWRSVATGYSGFTGPNLYQALFVGDETAIAVGEDGTILTVKRGALAASTRVGKPSLFALARCDGLAIAGGQQGMLATSRDGARWESAQIDGAPDVYGLGCMPGGVLVASSTGFLLTARHAAGKWKWQKLEPAGILLPWLLPVEPRSDREVFIGGPGGVFSARIGDGNAQ